MKIFSKAKEKAVGGGKKMLNYEQVSSVGSWIINSAKALSPWKKKAEGVRIETFEAATERLGVSEEDLGKQYQNHVLRFYLALMLWIGGTVITGFYLARGSWLSLLPYLGFTALCGAQMFSASLWALQIRRREFLGVARWAGMKSEWFPRELELPKAKDIVIKKRSQETSLDKRKKRT